MVEVFQKRCPAGTRMSGLFLTQGSAGTIAGCGDYLKEHVPTIKVGAGEAKQCPTLYENGFGAHRIEGIGDKHVPWIHNLKNTDVVCAIDDEQCMGSACTKGSGGKQHISLKLGVSDYCIDRISLPPPPPPSLAASCACSTPPRATRCLHAMVFLPSLSVASPTWVSRASLT